MSGGADASDRTKLVRLEAAVASLPRLDREIFLARILDGATFDEIAAATGLSREQAMRRIARAHIVVAPLMARRRSRLWRR